MTVELPKGPPVNPEVVIQVADWKRFQLRIDLRKCPSEALAIAMLEQAVRQLKLEEANASSVAFANRLAQEEMERNAMAALQNPRKM